MDSLPDDLLMLEVRNGDARKLGVLFERHHVALFNFYPRMTGDREASEDLVQDVFYRMLRYRHTFRPGTQFTTWMYQIARNARLDYFRKRRREVEINDDLPLSVNPSRQLESDQETALLRRALVRLPEDKREVLVLSRFHNLRYEDIGEVLGCQAGAVKVRVHRALRELREIFFELSGRKVS